MTTTTTIELRAAEKAGAIRETKIKVGKAANEMATMSRLSSMRTGATIQKDGSGPAPAKNLKEKNVVVEQQNKTQEPPSSGPLLKNQ